MAKSKVNANIADQTVNFVTGVKKQPETGVVLHSSKLLKKVGELKEDYDIIINQISFILNDTNSSVEESGFKLDEIKVSLAFNAKGKIGFIAEAEAGVEAGIELTFKRK
jgi:hypothetical protein